MKRLLLLFFIVVSLFARGQNTYRPSNTGYFTPSNKPFAPATPIPTDGRTYKADTVNGLFRPYAGTSEVLSYLPTGSQYRIGQFPIVVNIGGSLQSNGTFVGGEITVWWFLKGQADSNLVRMDSTASASCTTCLLKANNLSDVQSLITTLINLNLNNVDNTSDATKNAATATLTNKTISGTNNTFSNIPNSALVNNSIGLTLNSTGSSPTVTTSPAALGTSLVLSVPNGNGSNDGFILHGDWTNFHLKVDSTTESGDSVYDWHNGSASFRYVIPAGTGAVLSVNNVDGTITFSPTTGNVVGSVNQGANFTWTGTNTFTGAPTFSSLTTNGGVFYGNGSGTLQQSPVGTSGQIFESQGASGPIFFTPNLATVTGWLGYTPLSSALGSTHIFVGNGSNIATDVAATGDWTLSNTGVNTIGNNKITYAKIQAAGGQALLGATGAGNYQEITLGTNLSMSGTTLNATGGSGISLTTNPTTASSPTLISSTLNIDSFRYSRIYNVKDYNALGDGIIVGDVSISSGSANATSISTIFTSADIGKIIKIDSAAVISAVTVDLVDTITAVGSAHSITLSHNATNSVTNATACYGTDDAKNIQKTINACFNGGGGTVWVPRGIYVSADTIRSNVLGLNPNSLLYVPVLADPLGNAGQTEITVRMEGEQTPDVTGSVVLYRTQTPMNGSIIYCFSAPRGVAYPSILATGNCSAGGFSAVDIQIKNMGFRTVEDAIGGNGPQIGGLNLGNFYSCDAENISVSVDQPAIVTVQPTNSVFGINMLSTSSGTFSNATNTLTIGYPIGTLFGEHYHGLNVQAYACNKAFGATQANHSSYIDRAGVYWCNYAFSTTDGYIIGTGTHTITVGQLSMEVDTISSHWWHQIFSINDASNFLSGSVGYHIVKSGVTGQSNYLFSKTGGTNFNSITSESIYAPVASTSWDASLTAGNTTTQQPIINGFQTTRPTINLGSTGRAQNLSQGDFFFGENLTYNSGYKYINTGAASQLYFFNEGSNGTIIAQTSPSGTGGTSASVRAPLAIIGNGDVDLGGNISDYTGVGTGAMMIVKNSGALFGTQYGVGTFTGTPTFSAQFNSSGQFIEGPVLASNTWTPTVTPGTNVSAGTGNSCTYTRVGNVVTFAGSVNLTITLASTASVANISIPIGSTFTATTDANGVLGSNAGFSVNPVNLIANTSTGNTMILNFGSAVSTGGYIIFFSGQYLVH